MISKKKAGAGATKYAIQKTGKGKAASKRRRGTKVWSNKITGSKKRHLITGSALLKRDGGRKGGLDGGPVLKGGKGIET